MIFLTPIERILFSFQVRIQIKDRPFHKSQPCTWRIQNSVEVFGNAEQKTIPSLNSPSSLKHHNAKQLYAR